MKKIKKFFNNVWVQNLIIMAGIGFSFVVLDLGLRILADNYITFYGWKHYSPLLFSISWAFLFIGIIYLLPKKGKIIFYSIINVLFNVIVFAQYIYVKIFDRFFGFSDFLMTGEGKDYFGYSLKQIDIKIILIVLLSLGSMIVTNIIISKSKEFKKDKYYYPIVILSAIICIGGTRYLAVDKLGLMYSSTGWEAAEYPRNIYEDFNNQSKNVKVAGIYEQCFRNIYLYTKEVISNNKKEYREDVDKYIKENGIETLDNEYTGIFKDKNVIYVLLESIDTWLVNDEVMPTLVNLEKTGWNFTNRYAPTFGGGQTINSEFASLTGLYASENKKAIYNFDSNNFKYSLPNLLKDKGYEVNSFHANKGDFYSRKYFHKTLGFTEHYSFTDMGNIDHENYNYFNDTAMIRNDETYKMIVRDNKFMSFITTYSAHLPYDNTNDRCITNPYNLNVDNNVPYSCIRNLAKETDEMLRLLIERLKEDNKLDDTVLVLYTDHYGYGYEDQEFIYDLKKEDNVNLLQNVPFVIWSNDIKHKNIDTIMDTADILPTVLNLLGIKYDTNNYSGTDVFSSNHEKFVYFNDYTWYDGKKYYNSKDKINDSNREYANKITKLVANKININDKIILGDYFDK